MKKNLIFSIKVIMLLLLISISYMVCHHVLIGKNGMGRIHSFYQEEPDSLDAVFIGSSHLYLSVFPLQLWEDYGIKSSVIGGDGMGVPLEYYCVREAIRKQHPDVIVVDLYKAFSEAEIENISYTHNLVNGWPYSLNMSEMVQDLIPEENRIEFYLPLYLYHTRWNELSRTDFLEQVCYTKGAAPQFGVYDASGFTEIAATENQEIPEIVLEYIVKMIQVCQDNNVELIFTVMPYETNESTHYQQKIFNALDVELEKYQIPYYNGFHMMDELNLDLTTDFFDSGHLNYDGGVKATAYLGNLLSREYLNIVPKEDLSWDYAAEEWNAYIRSRQIKNIQDTTHYLQYLNEASYDYVLMINKNGTAVEQLRQNGFLDEMNIDNGKYVIVKENNNEKVYNIDDEKVQILFHNRWLQIPAENTDFITIDKQRYDFSEEVKIILYDNYLDTIIDTAALNNPQVITR